MAIEPRVAIHNNTQHSIKSGWMSANADLTNGTMMPIRVDCPCGRQLRLKDELLGMRIKCPDCGDALDVPETINEDATLYSEEVDDSEFEPPEPTPTPRRKKKRTKRSRDNAVTGKPVTRFLGLNLPSFVGSASFAIEEDRLVLQSNGWTTQRDCEVFLADIHSVEVSTGRHPMLLILTIFTLAIYVWVLFLLLYLVLSFRTLSVHATGTTTSIRISKKDERATDFVDQIMSSARAARHDTTSTHSEAHR